MDCRNVERDDGNTFGRAASSYLWMVWASPALPRSLLAHPLTRIVYGNGTAR